MRYQVPVDTGMFSPVGLQPVAVCRLGFNAAAGWLAQNGVSHRRLVSELRIGFVVWSAQLSFEERVGFVDSDCLEMDVDARVRGGGLQLEVSASIGDAARFSAVCVPLRLDGDEGLAGVPAALRAEVIAVFEDVETASHRSPVPALRARVLREGARIVTGRMPFKIHRHQCEVADQWFWPEAVALASASREEMCLVEAMRTPVRHLDLLFSRPFFLFDEGEVASSAYRWQGRLVCVHELMASKDEKPRAVVLERF